MDDLKFSELRAHNACRCAACFHPLDAWTPTDWATAVAGETGELCNLIKKVRRGEDIEPRHIADEMADTVIYLDLLAARMGIDLGAAVREKFDRTSAAKGYRMALPMSGRVGSPLIANTGPVHAGPAEDEGPADSCDGDCEQCPGG